MRSLLAITVAKAILKVNRITGSGGSSLPGLVAKKFDPDILKKLVQNNFPKGIIVVTGTNGKTTTTSLIANILNQDGVSFVHNKTGSNMERGLISTMIESASMAGKFKAEVGLFEVDEAYMPKVCRAINPSWIVVTNLFRDQLDRYGELDKVARSFRDLFEDLPGAQLVLNADDPLVASLGYNLETDQKPIYFGVDDYVGPKLVNDHTADSIFNPFTQEKLYYTQQYFGHIGKYRGKSGGFTRPKPDYNANNVKQTGTTNIKFNINNSKDTVKLDLVGLFNVYNALAAFSLVKSATGTPDDIIYSALKQSSAAFGRSEEVDFDGRSLLLLLIKNPTGLNQIIQTYLSREKDRLLVFVINDNYADGRDVSWLWDAALEDLKSYKGKIIVGGTRANDMALRLKYAGLGDILVETDNNKLIEAILANSTKRSKIFLLPTYTAMLDLRAKLTAQDTKTKEYWK